MYQKYTSANTSVNSSRVPSIFKKIDFPAMPNGCVWDWGCGKFNTAKDYVEKQGFQWAGLDPYNRSEEENKHTWEETTPDVIVCSNVLNVIDNVAVIADLANAICEAADFYIGSYFISVYEGDRSGVGHKTKEDCYQRNEKVQAYLRYFPGAVIKHGVITNAPEFVK